MNPPPTPPPELRRTIGFWGGIALLVGVVIGSGIFRTPPEIARAFASPTFILALWALGGLLCLAGALSLAELAAMKPQSGGVYVFIREAFGPCPAFVFGWSYLLLVKPFAAGGIALIFGEHVHILLGLDPKAHDPRIPTTIMLVGLTLINIRGVRLSTGVAAVLTALKFGALAAIVVLGAVLAGPSTPPAVAAAAPAAPDFLATVAGVAFIPALVGAMAGILWTYDGWADVGSVAGEVKNPQRLLPRIYIAGTFAVIAVYLAVNAVYFRIVPIEEMRTLGPGASVAPLVMERLVGPAAATVVVLIVLVSTLGSSHASILTGARVSYAQARDGLLFRFIGHVHPRYNTPDTSLIAQVFLSIVAIWTLGSFQSLMEGFVFTMWIFYAMAALAVIVLRVKRPDEHRPFRCPGYPLVPAVFVLVAAAMTALSIASDPRSTLPWIGILLAGVPVYFIWQKLTARRASN